MQVAHTLEIVVSVSAQLQKLLASCLFIIYRLIDFRNIHVYRFYSGDSEVVLTCRINRFHNQPRQTEQFPWPGVNRYVGSKPDFPLTAMIVGGRQQTVISENSFHRIFGDTPVSFFYILGILSIFMIDHIPHLELSFSLYNICSYRLSDAG